MIRCRKITKQSEEPEVNLQYGASSNTDMRVKIIGSREDVQIEFLSILFGLFEEFGEERVRILFAKSICAYRKACEGEDEEREWWL